MMYYFKNELNMGKIKRFQILSVIFVWITGTLLHFTHDCFPNSAVFTIISAVNESMWEHLKLVFFPMLFMTVIGYFYNKDINNFLYAKLASILVAMSFIVVFFYTYTGVIGRNFAVLDIGNFFVAVALGEYYAYKIMLSDKDKIRSALAVAILVVIFLCFAIFTYYPPSIGLFANPLIG